MSREQNKIGVRSLAGDREGYDAQVNIKLTRAQLAELHQLSIAENTPISVIARRAIHRELALARGETQ